MKGHRNIRLTTLIKDMLSKNYTWAQITHKVKRHASKYKPPLLESEVNCLLSTFEPK